MSLPEQIAFSPLLFCTAVQQHRLRQYGLQGTHPLLMNPFRRAKEAYNGVNIAF